ncbi:hypothetical protein D3C84_713260 [compost metagenome]
MVPVLRREVGGMQLDADAVADGLGIGQVHLGGAVLGAVVLVPVLHEQAFHLVALLEEQEGGNRGVDAAGHADYDAGIGWITHGNLHWLVSKSGILTGLGLVRRRGSG